ncbi:HupE/UreJ family protein [Shimia sp.]|uniref:HupE/UreJ family protein n=1 Tax=Shimia sp. TaxID=1954381 RepID=UPI0032990431
MAFWVQAGSAHAHALEPGYLELKPMSENTWRVFWSRPDVQGRPMAIDAVLPEDCEMRQGPSPRFDGSAWTTQWVTRCSNGMQDSALVIQGLELTQTDVLVRYELVAGDVATKRLVPDETGFVLSVTTGWAEVLWAYLTLGFDHILDGIDHLLFVFALLLLIPDRWRLIGAITAFTVAHSITLAAATLGLVALPSAPVEAIIALSIMFLATELVKRQAGSPRVSERYPWIVSFSFGLLHGFGFAGALGEIGLPQGDVPLALLSFNLGVEAGQLAFVACVFVLAELLRRVVPRLVKNAVTPGAPVAIVLAYGIGAVSAYWFLDRLAGFV